MTPVMRNLAGPYSSVAFLSILCLFLITGGTSIVSAEAKADAAIADWLQFNFDEQHSGNNPREAKIGVANVGRLHRLYRVKLPDVADGAPAHEHDISTPIGNMDLLFLTTKDGHIVALDARSGKTVWVHQYGPGDLRINNGFKPVYTTSSPAIDPNRRFVYSYGLDGRVHKYRIGDGLEIRKDGWPQVCTLKPFNEKGSSALAVAVAGNGEAYLYVANGGYLGDRGDYQGHITAVNLRTGSQKVFNANCSNRSVHFVQQPGEPDCPAVRSAIWSRPGVVYDPATDKIYMATGNGPFEPERRNWGDTVLALNPDGTGLNGNPTDTYTPRDHQELRAADLDLGSTAPAILPTPLDSAVRHLAVQGGKAMQLHLLNLADLNGHHAPGYAGGEIGQPLKVPQGGMVFTQPAVWISPQDRSTWVFLATYEGLSALKLRLDQQGQSLKPMWQNSRGGSSPILANGILCCAGSHAIHAYDPITGNVLWETRDIGKIHWESPIVVNGRLYIMDESGNLTAFGF